MRRPTPVLTDVRGSVIDVGVKVAYNISGDVALGEVERLDSSGRIFVRLAHRAAGQPPGHISRVRHATSVLVLKETDV